MNKFEQDIVSAANMKLASIKEAGIGDQLGSAISYLTGKEGTLPTSIYGLGGAGLGAMAGSSMGVPGMLGGAALGGLMGFGGANAINQQMGMQQDIDSMLANGMLGGLKANDMTDQAQTQAIIQQGQMLDDIINYLSSGGTNAAEPVANTDIGALDPGIAQQSIADPMAGSSVIGASPNMPPGAMNGIGNPAPLKGNEKKSSMSIDAMAQAIAKRLVHG